MTPMILITTARAQGEYSPQRRQSALYGECLAQCGAVGVLYTKGEAARLAVKCDGLLLAGGGDPHPSLYGQEQGKHPLQIDRVRDKEEAALFSAFVAQRKPILGICRGMQLLNVLLGGTLHQHMENHAQGTHTIRCEGRFADWLGDTAVVNSYHHQAIDELAPCLQATAYAQDGQIEAVVHTAAPIFGVQWHPERLVPAVQCDVENANHIALFRYFCILCAQSLYAHREAAALTRAIQGKQER